MIDTIRIIADAKVAACYLQALMIEGVQSQDAIQLTGTYMTTHRITEMNKETKAKEQGS